MTASPWQEQYCGRDEHGHPCVSDDDFTNNDRCLFCGKKDTVFNCKWHGVGMKYAHLYLHERERAREAANV